MIENQSTKTLHSILSNDAILETLCLFLPSITIRLRRVSHSLARYFHDEKLSELLPSVFEKLGLFYSNPFEHCQNGDAESTWLMLVHGIDPQIISQNGDTLLQAAVQSGSVALAHLLVERGCAVSVKGAFGYTPLHQAAYTPYSNLAEFLLKHGGNLDSLSKNGSTPLLIAAREGHTRVAETMLRFGADPNDGGDKGLSPLLLASAEGHLEMVNLLLLFKADANLSLYEGRTALHEASESGHAEICRLLISQGKASLNAMDDMGETPLTIAARHGREDVLGILRRTCFNPSQASSIRLPDKKSAGPRVTRLRFPPEIAISN